MQTQWGCSAIARPIHNLVARWGWVVNATPRPLNPMARTPVLLVEEAGCQSGRVWRREKSHAPIRVRTHHRPASSKTLRFPGPHGQVSYVLIARDVDISSYSISLQKERGAVGGGTTLLAGRSQVRFWMVSLEFFINIILPWSRLSL